jgi:hypothetical protein
MIGNVLGLVRDLVVVPQAVVPDVEARAWFDPDNTPLDAYPANLEVVALSSDPINPQIGAGFGGVAGGTVSFRHTVAVVLTVEDADRETALARRDPIVRDLVRRAWAVDWTNALPAEADETVDKVSLAIDYAELETEQLAAYATVTFTIDTEWRL